MNKQKPMATIIAKKQTTIAASKAGNARRILHSLSRRPQASRQQPKVFCDPKMPGSWKVIAETASGSFAA